MRVYTKAGDLAVKTFTFPDGQTHFSLESYEREFDEITIELAIKNSSDLLVLLLACDTCRNMGYQGIRLDIRYLLGARMDRAIDATNPFTLQTIARIINSCGFSRVRILDAHSEVATKLIRNSVNVLPKIAVNQVLASLGDVDIVIPDKGATIRVNSLGVYVGHWMHQCFKERDPQTGKLTNFRVPTEGLKGRNCLIIDDICDGGGTFVGLAKELKAAGARNVFLFVTHGIFSRGLPLENIEKVFTTDSYTDPSVAWNATIIPISMKDIK